MRLHHSSNALRSHSQMQPACCRHAAKLLALVALLLIFGLGTVSTYAQTWEKRRTPKSTPRGLFNYSRYDYSQFAASITAGAHSDYQKIRAIYQWICENIAYDTSYSIYTADECVDAGKGVCQAYCELFYELAKAVGVRVDIISGKARDSHGSVGGHAWLFAYTSKDKGFLLDPTWGAGSVDGRQFHRRNNCWIWFDVSPEWMLLSHYPDDKNDQLVARQLSWSEFMAQPNISGVWPEYGVDATMLCNIAKSGTFSMPEIYSGGEGEVELLEFPHRQSLRIGEPYTFRIKIKDNRQFAIINGTTYSKTPEWQTGGYGVYTLSFIPREKGDVSFSLKDPSSIYWNSIIRYKVEPPTAADWKKLESNYPLSTPDASKVKNLDTELWKQAGVDEQTLLKHIRAGNIKELPIIYSGKGQRFRIVSVPMNKHLSANQPYTFSFYPQSGIRWAVVNNNKWYHNFQVASDGKYTITVTPSSGKLSLYVQFAEGESYWACLEYDVR